MSQVQVGDRAFLKDSGIFGDVQRTTVLGLANCPVVQRDDGEVYAFLGSATTEVVNKQTGSDGKSTVEVPVDVRLVGIDLLTAHGTPADVQTRMFDNFIALPRAQRDAMAASFKQVNPADSTALGKFLDNMVAALDTPPASN